ncbi:hypothetical protein GCWU000325_00449 [Alloprevotella tannerae ATCC 51259]|uniref:Uncharacterized protein n=1 Tax=Alloprevotella tannerae ATCC 51259 TaxID=626522 RepID=C9LE25_9BACT|nr:hypothetical protein GCWU000325_00449 [Alloprevotella tannerae ATCC 51259]
MPKLLLKRIDFKRSIILGKERKVSTDKCRQEPFLHKIHSSK